LVRQWRLTFRQHAVASRHYDWIHFVAASNGASTLHLANPCFNLAYPVCERRVAVCYAQAKFHSNPTEGSFDFPI
jgi:hypothetical protein